MSVTDRLMLPGSWSLTLRDDTPPSVLDAVDLDANAFGHVIITPTWLPATTFTTAQLLALARYTGILRERPSKYELGGPGLAAWLGDEDGKGDVLETAVAKTAGTFVQWVTDLRPSSLTAGTYTAIAGGLTHVFHYVSRREALDYVCDYFGGEWRVNPDGTLDAGAEADLFTTTPQVVFQPHSGGRDATITGLYGAVDLSRDMDDFTTRVVLIGNEDTGSADIASVAYLDLNGNPVDWVRVIESSNTRTGNEDAVAQAQLNRFTGQRRAIQISSDQYDLGGDFAVGDTIYVYDPEQGLFDTANEVSYRGQTIWPLALRVLGMTWPVQPGMGVYVRAPDADGTITDLTDWVDWEAGATTVEVGATPRRITSDTAASGRPRGPVSGTGTSSADFTGGAGTWHDASTVSLPAGRWQVAASGEIRWSMAGTGAVITTRLRNTTSSVTIHEAGHTTAIAVGRTPFSLHDVVDLTATSTIAVQGESSDVSGTQFLTNVRLTARPA